MSPPNRDSPSILPVYLLGQSAESCLFRALLHLGIQHTCGGGYEILYGLFPPGGFGGVVKLQIILTDDLGRGGIVCGIPVVPVFVDGVLEAQNGVEEGIADGAEFKAGGEQVCICLLLVCQTVEEVRGVTGGGVEGFGVIGNDVVIAEGLLGFRLAHGFVNGIEDDHVVPGSITGVDVDMDDVFVAAI